MSLAETVATPGAKVIGEDSIGLRVESSRPPELLSKDQRALPEGVELHVFVGPEGDRRFVSLKDYDDLRQKYYQALAAIETWQREVAGRDADIDRLQEMIERGGSGPDETNPLRSNR